MFANSLVSSEDTANTSICKLLAPASEVFSRSVYQEWGAGGIVFLTIPPLLAVLMLAIFAEEIHYIVLKSNSKELKTSLLWILGTHPAILVFGTIAIFVPRSLVYMGFMYTIYVAFALYKYYYLIMVFTGGTKSFVDKSEMFDLHLNSTPCCCLVCLPTIKNSMKVTLTTKWLIFQNVILTPFYGALGMLLKSDFKLYSTQGVPAAVYLAVLNSLSTLICMYGFKTISTITQKIEGMEMMHAVKGKTVCMQLTLFTTGFEGLIFNLLAQFDSFPCVLPFNFESNRKAFYNYAVVIQAFLLGLMARHFFRRKDDIVRQAMLTDDEATLTNNITQGAVASSVDRVLGGDIPSYNGTGSTSNMFPEVSDKRNSEQHLVVDDNSSV